MCSGANTRPNSTGTATRNAANGGNAHQIRRHQARRRAWKRCAANAPATVLACLSIALVIGAQPGGLQSPLEVSGSRGVLGAALVMGAEACRAMRRHFTRRAHRRTDAVISASR